MTKFVSKVVCGSNSESDNNAGRLNSRERLLRSAEELFSSKEYRHVSVREIAAHAGVNSGLVGYYFGGKRALFSEVLRAHTAPLSQELMQQLKIITQNGRAPSVEEILRAWLIPWLQARESSHARSLHLGIFANMSREGVENTKKALAPMDPVHKAFVKALHSCLPYLSQETIIWRLHFVMGALVFGLIQPGALMAMSGRRCDSSNGEASFNHLLPYAIAGFHAPEFIDSSTNDSGGESIGNEALQERMR